MKYSTRQTYFHGQGHLTKKFPTERVAEYEHRLLQSIERLEDLDTRVQAVGSLQLAAEHLHEKTIGSFMVFEWWFYELLYFVADRNL